MKTCLITGATSGIGRATALELGHLGWNLWLVGRDVSRGVALESRINAMGEGAGARFVPLDVSDLTAVRSLAARVRSEAGRLDVLINNAGARFMNPGRSVDGIELTFATNYLGHFLLALLMVDLLAESGDGRVVSVASGTHSAGKGDFEGVLKADPYDGRLSYAESKLAVVLFTRELSRRLQGVPVAVNAVDPGGVATRFGRNNGLVAWLRHCAYYLRQRSLLTPRQGCRTVVHLAAAKDFAGVTGQYWYEQQIREPSAVAQDSGLGQRLWDRSIGLVGLRRNELRSPWAERLGA